MIQRDPPPQRKGENPKQYVLQNFEELRFVDNIQCPQRGQLRLFRFHPFAKYMASKLVCSVPAASLKNGQADELIRQYQSRCKIKQPHIIYSIASESQKIIKNTPQGPIELFQIYLFFEYLQLTLLELTERRIQRKYLMPETEVWCLVKGIIAALVYLQQLGINHGMLSLKTIYFDEEYLLYRVYDQELISGRWGNWSKCQQYKRGKSDLSEAQYKETLLLLCPEQRELLHLEQNQMEEKVDPFKADVYAFGIILIQHLQLNMNQDCLKLFYSKEILQLIKICTEKDPKLRADWIKLQEFVNKLPKDLVKHKDSPVKQPPQISNKNSPQNLSQTQNQQQEEQKLETNDELATQFATNAINTTDLTRTTSSNISEENIDQKLLQLNLKIQETLLKSFQKTKNFQT